MSRQPGRHLIGAIVHQYYLSHVDASMASYRIDYRNFTLYNEMAVFDFWSLFRFF